MYQASYYELLASALVTKRAHEIAREMGCELLVGNMIAMNPVYPASSKPEDILMAEWAMQSRYFRGDVHATGQYPNWIKKFWAHKGFKIDITPADAKILAENIVDYVDFSYYMFWTVSNTGDE